MNYDDVMYGYKPRTDYPKKLVKYLIKRFLCEHPEEFGCSMLDVAPGRGEFLKAFEHYGWGAFKTSDDLNLENGVINDNFDVVFAKSIIEHVLNTDNFMKQCDGALWSYGELIILTPNWKSQWRTFYDDPTHIRPFTVESLAQLFRIYDFNVVACEEFYQLPIVWKHPWLKIFRHIPIRAKTGFWRWIHETMVLGVGKKNVRIKRC